jgi:CBS domain-containing protein
VRRKEQEEKMIIERLMSHEVNTCNPDQPLSEAARLMWEHDCGCVPVVASDRRVVGMITDRDICMSAYTRGRGLQELRIADAMSRDVRTCRADDTVEEAEATMRSAQVRRLPVVDDREQLVGLISLSDLAREAAREHGSKRRDVSDADVGNTLAAITRPRQIAARAAS